MLPKGKVFFFLFTIFQKMWEPFPGTEECIASRSLKFQNTLETRYPRLCFWRISELWIFEKTPTFFMVTPLHGLNSKQVFLHIQKPITNTTWEKHPQGAAHQCRAECWQSLLLQRGWESAESPRLASNSLHSWGWSWTPASCAFTSRVMERQLIRPCLSHSYTVRIIIEPRAWEVKTVPVMVSYTPYLEGRGNEMLTCAIGWISLLINLRA